MAEEAEEGSGAREGPQNKREEVNPTAAKKPEKQYSEGELERLFRDAGRKGAILALMHFDAYGQDKEVIREALVELVGRVTHEPGVIYCRGEVEEVMEKEAPRTGKESAEEEGKPPRMEYSTFTEVKILFSSISRAVSLCLKYAPVGIEILEPRELKLSAEEIQNLMLDTSAMSQQYTNFYMQKILKGEEFQEFQKHLKARAEIGKSYLDKAKGAQAQEERK